MCSFSLSVFIISDSKECSLSINYKVVLFKSFDLINYIQIMKVELNNECFNPAILKLLTYYMPLTPLWSGLILNQVKDNSYSI